MLLRISVYQHRYRTDQHPQPPQDSTSRSVRRLGVSHWPTTVTGCLSLARRRTRASAPSLGATAAAKPQTPNPKCKHLCE